MIASHNTSAPLAGNRPLAAGHRSRLRKKITFPFGNRFLACNYFRINKALSKSWSNLVAIGLKDDCFSQPNAPSLPVERASSQTPPAP
jgi:hypothetical protein